MTLSQNAVSKMARYVCLIFAPVGKILLELFWQTDSLRHERVNPFHLRVAFILKANLDLQDIKRKVQYLIFRNFLLVLTMFSFWKKDWTLNLNSMDF